MANGQKTQCNECGCSCNKFNADQEVHLHIEIENLKQKLLERDSHITTMETNVLNEANKFPNGEYAALQEEVLAWQDKYKRLYDAHRRIQRVNQGLEDKLLRLVDICETEKATLTKDVATLSHKLAEANYAVKKLTDDNERYKEDVSLAIQFLQCKQSNFVSQKLDSLPNEVQAKVSLYVAGKRKPEEKKAQPEVKSIKVPIPTFPPTAMVYSIPKSLPTEKIEDESESSCVDIVSAAIMAKVLEERERERALAKHCDTCTCSKGLKIIHDTITHSVGTQTGDYKNSLCLRCNTQTSNMDSLKIVKNLPTNKSKSVPIYTHDYDNNFLQVENGHIIRPNVVKVEPNNYLKENVSVSSNEDLLNLKNEQKTNKLSDFQTANCDVSAKNSKGPRYCSVRVQSGSKNILLDNIHNNVAPVLYTHPTDKKSKKEQTNSKISQINSVQIEVKNSISSHAPTYSSDDSKSFNLFNESMQNQQRVAEWIQTNQDNGNYPSNSKIVSSERDNFTNSIDPVRYAEMENNVKKFLLGDSQNEFFKKVAIGKQNYQNLRGYNSNSNVESQTSKSSSHTETEI